MPVITSGDMFTKTFEEMRDKPVFGPERTMYGHGKDGAFTLSAVCVSNVPARDRRFEYMLEIGRGALEAIYDRHELPGGSELRLNFPERHLSQAERQNIFEAILLLNAKSDDPITYVEVVTSDPLVIGNCGNLMVWKEDALNERLNTFLGRHVVG